MNLADAMERAQVLDFELQKQLVPLMRDMVPLPGIYDPAFIAANQAERADNIIKGSKREQVCLGCGGACLGGAAQQAWVGAWGAGAELRHGAWSEQMLREGPQGQVMSHGEALWEGG